MSLDKQIKKLQKQVSDNQLSRRGFMKGAVALGVGAMAPSLYSEAAKAAPKVGGTYRMGLGGANTGDSMDPATTSDTFMLNMNHGAVRNQLVRVNENGEAVAELAASLEPSADAATWRVKMKQGIEFHSGKTLTLDDVVASIEHHRGEDSTSAAKSVAESMGEISKDGDSLVFSLQSGNADFPYLLSDYHILIGNADASGAIDWASGDGTGAYVMGEFEPGVRATMTRNPNYFIENEGNFDEVHMTAINDTAARMNAMVTGQVDAIVRCDLKTAGLLEKKPDVDVLQVTGTKHFTFPMDIRSAPFDNNDVRMALKYGMDRQGFVDTVLRGYGSVGNDHPIASTQNYHASDLPQREYDIDKAKWHLKQAGLTSLDVELSAADAAFGGAVDASELYAEALKPAAINLKVNRVSPDGYWDNVWMKVPWSACYWSGRPTADWMFTLAYANASNWTDTFWNHARFEELLVAGRAELDEAKRNDIYVEMQTIVSNEGGVVVPCFVNNVDAASTALGKPDKIAGNWDLDGARSASRWWFA